MSPIPDERPVDQAEQQEPHVAPMKNVGGQFGTTATLNPLQQQDSSGAEQHAEHRPHFAFDEQPLCRHDCDIEGMMWSDLADDIQRNVMQNAGRRGEVLNVGEEDAQKGESP
jgi:hypothetical protein